MLFQIFKIKGSRLAKCSTYVRMVKVFVEWRKIFLRAQKWGNFIFDQLMDYGHENREKRQTSKTKL